MIVRKGSTKAKLENSPTVVINTDDFGVIIKVVMDSIEIDEYLIRLRRINYCPLNTELNEVDFHIEKIK